MPGRWTRAVSRASPSWASLEVAWWAVVLVSWMFPRSRALTTPWRVPCWLQSRCSSPWRLSLRAQLLAFSQSHTRKNSNRAKSTRNFIRCEMSSQPFTSELVVDIFLQSLQRFLHCHSKGLIQTIPMTTILYGDSLVSFCVCGFRWVKAYPARLIPTHSLTWNSHIVSCSVWLKSS